MKIVLHLGEVKRTQRAAARRRCVYAIEVYLSIPVPLLATQIPDTWEASGRYNASGYVSVIFYSKKHHDLRTSELSSCSPRHVV